MSRPVYPNASSEVIVSPMSSAEKRTSPPAPPHIREGLKLAARFDKHCFQCHFRFRDRYSVGAGRGAANRRAHAISCHRHRLKCHRARALDKQEGGHVNK